MKGIKVKPMTPAYETQDPASSPAKAIRIGATYVRISPTVIAACF